jgi:sugar phosphate isomerase/epimerase
MKKVVYGVQLFGCMEICRKNPDDFFRRSADMGYELVEPCVAIGEAALPERKNMHFLNLAELDEYVNKAKTYGLRVESCHVAARLNQDSDLRELCNIASNYGIKHVMTGGPSGNYAEMFDQYTQTLQSAAAEIAKSGCKLCIHNGPSETREQINGKTFLEAALEHCGGSVGVQFDVGWALVGGVNPFEYMKKIEPYLLTLHYKDIKKNWQNLPISEMHIGLGEGALENLRGIFEYAQRLGIPQLMDQDKSDISMIDDLEKAIALLHSFE